MKIFVVVWLLSGLLTHYTHMKWLKEKGIKSTNFVKHVAPFLVGPLFLIYVLIRKAQDETK